MTAINSPQALKLNNKYITYPYINPKDKIDPVYRLLVDIEEEEKSNSLTVSLKYAYCEFYPKYQEYLNEYSFESLDNEIRDYYDEIIKTKIHYKYKSGQFGYISLTDDSNLEESFVFIENVSKYDKEIFFLHDDLEKYKYRHYDITSPTPKQLTSNGWITESSFTPIDGTMDATNDANDATKDLIKLLNWKICREDYLLKKMTRMKIKMQSENNNNINNGIRINTNNMSSPSSDNISITDEDEISYVPETDIDSKSSCYTSTDNDYNYINSADITHSQISYDKSSAHSAANSNDDKYHQKITTEYGYSKDKDLGYTLKGELFIAVNMNINKNEEPVAIKKMSLNGFRIVIDSELVKEALILRDLKTKNELIRNSIVNYIDFFQSQSYFYLVMELNFSVNLKQFVMKSHEYIKKKQLDLMEYKEIIKYLLWRLTATIYWLHDDMNFSDLDICPENIMLSRADFIKNNNDNSVAINLQIEMKLVDVGMNEILNICSYGDKIKQFKSNHNTAYITSSENQQYLIPNNNITTTTKPDDMWSFGMVIYYCFIGQYPYNIITETDDLNNDQYDGFWAVKNGKLQKYLAMKNHLQFIDADVLSLINGLLNIDDAKRLKATNVLKHKWFNSFYKTYLSLCTPIKNE